MGLYFGGDLNYGNIRSYIFNKNFDVIKEERIFDSNIPRGKLGIQDKDMAGEYIKLLNQAESPVCLFLVHIKLPHALRLSGRKKTFGKNRK